MRGNAHTGLPSQEMARLLALALPLLVRFLGDGMDAAPKRLAILVLSFSVAWAWSALFTRQLRTKPEIAHASFATLFTLMLPAPVGLGGALIAASFGWVVGHAIFGGKGILPPALVALAFAITSFPEGGYETLSIFSAPPDPLLALSCLPGAAWLLWRRALPWRFVAGAIAGAIIADLLLAEPESVLWWEHFILGTFSVGILFMAALPECMPNLNGARWLHGAMVGGLIITIRLTNPDAPDGVVLAILVAGLFAPLLDRALRWRDLYA